MNIRIKTIICLLLSAVCILAACGGGPGHRIKDIEAQKASPTPTPGEREISGVFNVNGADSNGNDPYSGSLSVVPKGSNYEFRWATTKGTRIGTGIQMGNAVAVSYAPTGGGKGCGVVLYKIDSDGTLNGHLAGWGEETLGQERAFHSEGANFVGKYLVAGSRADGTSYTDGKLIIKKDGSGYNLEWQMDKPRVAFGIWKGSVAAASFGGPQCSFVLYDVSSSGNMEGNWGGQKTVTFGAETAKRK